METIRPASLDDAAGIARVHVDSWKTTYKGIFPDTIPQFSYEWRENLWQRSLSNPERQNVTFVATDGRGRIVGFVDGGPERQPHPIYKGELYKIYLLDEYQRRGLGRRLVKALAEQLLQRGFSTMRLWVMQGNPAERFYASLGGQPTETTETELKTSYGVATTLVSYGWQDIQPLLSIA